MCIPCYAGLASYMNVAVTDPLQQLGVVAFDDTELAAAAPPSSALGDNLNAPEENLKTLYVVAFSRNCTGA